MTTLTTVVLLHQRLQAAGLILPLAHVSPELRRGFYQFQEQYAAHPPTPEPPKQPIGFAYKRSTRWRHHES